MTLSDTVVAELKKPLNQSRVKKLGGTGARAASYLEAHDVIDRANEIFGYDGWSFELIDVTQVHAATRDGEAVGVLFMAKGRLTIGDVVRIDVGTNDVSYAGENSRRTTGSATPDDFETAVKGAVSDCLKRCFRTWGNQFGNSLYEKDAPAVAHPPVSRPATPPANMCPIHKIQMIQGKEKIGHMWDGVPCFGEAKEPAVAQ